MLAQVLLLAVGLVAAFVGTDKRPIAGVGAEMGSETGRSVEGLVAVRVGALDGLQVGGKFARAAGDDGCRGVDCVCFGGRVPRVACRIVNFVMVIVVALVACSYRSASLANGW